MTSSDHSYDIDQVHASMPDQSALETTPPVGVTPPQVLAEEAAAGRRGAAWRLLHWIIQDDPRAVIAVSSLNDDRLAQNLLEFIALGTWAGKPFVVPVPLRTAHARTRLRTLFLPSSGMDYARVERVLIAAVADKRPAMRESAVYLLGIIGSRNATPLLIQALDDPIPAVRSQAAKALGRVGDATAVPALLRSLHTADEQMSSQIDFALGRLGFAAVPALIAESKSSSPWIRWHCIRALGDVCDSRVLPVLVESLRDPDHSVAWMGAKKLISFGKRCVEPLLHLLVVTDTSPWLVEAASYVLHNIYLRDKKLRPHLEPVVQSMHSVAYQIATPQAARHALSQLSAEGALING
ncbi:MAG TPA: HEAT repeat domain-containing protein [Ktedonobacteraceae bacterium]|nr:HEAT repeat domain-containing protein [Ktedonobacteraceae bacterium]